MLLHILPLSLTNIIAALLFYDFCYGDKFVETVEDGIDEACKSSAHSSLEEIAAAGYNILEMTRDLHSTEGEDLYESAKYTTEYEDKFSAAGKNINYVKF